MPRVNFDDQVQVVYLAFRGLSWQQQRHQTYTSHQPSEKPRRQWRPNMALRYLLEHKPARKLVLIAFPR